MKKTALVAGTIAILLGGLWLLQGLGLVTMEPILCFANCAPIEGPAPGWAIIGALSAAAGLVAVVYALRRPARGEDDLSKKD